MLTEAAHLLRGELQDRGVQGLRAAEDVPTGDGDVLALAELVMMRARALRYGWGVSE